MKKIGLVLLGLLLILGGIAFWQRDALQIWWHTKQLNSAAEADRPSYVDSLVALGKPAIPKLVEYWKKEDRDFCQLVRSGLENHFHHWKAEDPAVQELISQIFAMEAELTSPGRLAVLELIPSLLNTYETLSAEPFRPLVEKGLQDSDTFIRVQSITCAMRSDIQLMDKILPLLNDSTVEVRRAAMLSVGPSRSDTEPLIETDELLKWLHDPDEEVRRCTEIALGTRGLSKMDVHLGRLITHSQPAERLKILLDLPEDDRFPIANWLERLSRDPESSIRAGAARVAVERQVDFMDRLNEMIQSDPDQTVRKIAAHYQKLANSPER
jgi:hypothetical protein